MPILDPNDLVGSTFLIPQEDIQHLRARIVKASDNYDGKLQRDSERLKVIYLTFRDFCREEAIFLRNAAQQRVN